MRLCIETSSDQGSVALYDGSELVEQVLLGDAREHARFLAPTVKKLVQAKFHRLSSYAISIGPGSFTGLRIGLSFLKGLAAAHAHPAVGVSSLEVRAFALPIKPADRAARETLVLLDARRGQVFWGHFGAQGALGPDALWPLEQVKTHFAGRSLWVAGDGVPAELPKGWICVDRQATPSALSLGQRAELRFAAGQSCDAAELDPAYLQLSGAEERMGPAPGTVEALPSGHRVV